MFGFEGSKLAWVKMPFVALAPVLVKACGSGTWLSTEESHPLSDSRSTV